MLNTSKEWLGPIICYKLIVLENWRELKFLFILSEVWKTASEDLSYKSLSLITCINLWLKKNRTDYWCSQQIVLVFHTASLAFMRERKSSKSMFNLPRPFSDSSCILGAHGKLGLRLLSIAGPKTKKEKVLLSCLLPTHHPLGALQFTMKSVLNVCSNWHDKEPLLKVILQELYV